MNDLMGNIRKNEDQITEYQQILERKNGLNLEDLNCIASLTNSDIVGDKQDLRIFNKGAISSTQNLKSKKSAATKMLNGKKYRILIFDESGNNYITKIDATVGGPMPRWENAKKIQHTIGLHILLILKKSQTFQIHQHLVTITSKYQ
ncbi:hypothetical protein [Sphingobacterium bovisgrunnientis]|jgi:hypothetical protein|uniref:hypothetical protein n=1 Tax=Sphingobacterium bovisgrunnientis TaxID=1874697 RepID=UPI00135C1AED|nr:hypothetical protein [Sphingobacterium bovisgrunnientis]